MDVFTEKRIKDLLQRTIVNEIEFLNEDPETYKDLYLGDHELN